MSNLTVQEIVNFHQYAIAPLTARSTQALIQSCHTAFATNGYMLLKNFMTEPALTLAQAECHQLSRLAKYTTRYTNPYKVNDDPTLPPDHPIRQFAIRTNAFVAQNHFSEHSIFRTLYCSEMLQQFLAACLGLNAMYEYADPAGQLVLNVLPPNGQHPWHFDENDFSVVLMIQTAQQGGTLEIAPYIRTPQADNYEQVSQVLNGTSSQTETIDCQAGDLVIFNGKRSLHQVTRVLGAKERHTVILSYTQNPGIVGRAENNAQIFD